MVTKKGELREEEEGKACREWSVTESLGSLIFLCSLQYYSTLVYLYVDDYESFFFFSPFNLAEATVDENNHTNTRKTKTKRERIWLASVFVDCYYYKNISILEQR